MDWWELLLIVVAAGVGYAAHWAQAKVATKDNQDTIEDARLARALEHMRWAMDLMVSDDPASRRLGARQLEALSKTANLTDDELRLIRAANAAALETVLQEWDDEDTAGEESP